jgi:tetratricopeptide (TPR) repeat protein
MDADEELDPDSREPLLHFINTTDLDGAHFKVRNYTGRYSPQHYTTHIAMRLVRNNGRYFYTGAIHEQITCENAENIQQRFAPIDAVVHHYGYLDDVVAEKQKRKRNIPILEKQLARTPEEPFALFNMGNEYLSMRDYEKALAYYGKSLENAQDKSIAFVPHLYFRMASAYESLGRYADALKLLARAETDYPRCVDYEYARACNLLKLRRYTLAIEALENCLNAQPAPASLEFLPGCGTYRASHLLGDIYGQLEDYPKALTYYNMTLNYNSKYLSALYRAGSALNCLYADKDAVRAKLFEYFNDKGHTPNILVGADILINEELYEQALAALLNAAEPAGREDELNYLKGSACFFLGRDGEARSPLLAVCEDASASCV